METFIFVLFHFELFFIFSSVTFCNLLLRKYNDKHKTLEKDYAFQTIYSLQNTLQVYIIQIQDTIYSLQNTLQVYIIQIQDTIYIIQFTVYSIQYTLHSIQVYIIQNTEYSKKYTIYSLQYTLLTT